ncbi:MAG: hypothetical protein CMM64_02380 [Rhodospirillaceae bacterium]|nr:hypothetical protein [Rhodospirillaceae bacterium]
MVEIIKLFNNIISLMYVQEFRQRFISTTILSLLFSLLFLLDNIFLQFIFSMLFSFVFFEYEKLTSKTLQNFQIFKILILQILLLFFTIFESYKIEAISLLFNNFIIFLLISVFFNSIFLLYKKANLICFIISNIIILSFFSLIGILNSPNGLYIFLYAVILVSTMDIFAYLGGNLFGKRKIIPFVSKGKTVEGTIIGLVSTIIISYFIKDLINYNTMYSLVYGFFIGMFAFSGDLLESFFKRKIGVKDSGKLIPGHGGLMDRFDGYFLVIPFLHIFII